MVVRRLGGTARVLLSRDVLSLPNIRRRASNSWAAVRDTFFSTKQVFESHRVVFTVGTSIASVLTAWAGYSFRHMEQSRIDKRLHSIEQSLKDTHKVEREEIRKIVTSSNISTPACVATALTASVVGCALGWRGGTWYARRSFRREQQKLMGQIKSHNRWHWRPFSKLRSRLRTKSADAPRLLGRSTEAPSSSGASSSGASANVSSNSQAAGCT